jgi:predicted nucleotidyltransferase
MKNEISLVPEDWEVVRNLQRVLQTFHLDVHKIILFGSRVRSESTRRSDYDFLIIVNEAVEFQRKREIIRLIRRKMAELLIPVDVFIKSKKEFGIYKDVVGNIVYSADKEGITV